MLSILERHTGIIDTNLLWGGDIIIIRTLDCTLRDGGYINNWHFGRSKAINIVKKLETAGVDIIEVGFLDENFKTNVDSTVFNSIADLNRFITECKVNPNTNIVAMIMHGSFNVDDLPESDGILKGIRYCFKKDYVQEALEICRKIADKKYDVYLQPASLTDYSDLDLMELVNKANQLDIKAFYIVDTYGLMRREQVVRYFYIIDNNLRREVPIGFHSHNNLQLSFSNSQALIDICKYRKLYIDSSVFGMGRGAGNLCTELLIQYINDNIVKKYDLIPILEIMDECIMPIYSVRPWGYAVPYYIAATNDCHPNYATYLVDKQTLCIRDINAIIKSVPKECRHKYDQMLISKLYTQYQQCIIDDSSEQEKLRELCAGRKVLIVAPGKSVSTHLEEIKDYIIDNSPVVFVVNHVPDAFRFDRIFVANTKRYNEIIDMHCDISEKMICTSNIRANHSFCTVNYSSYLNDDDDISDNSGLMLINLLIKAGVNYFGLAGFDGYSSDSQNYYSDRMSDSVEYQKREQTNMAITSYFSRIQKNISLDFVTPSKYRREE